MPTIPEQLSALTLRDDFNRTNSTDIGASWTKIPGCIDDGKIEANTWTPESSFATGEDGAYWNAGEIADPAVKAGSLTSAGVGDFLAERWGAIWVAVSSAKRNGYRLRLVSLETNTTGTHEWRLEKLTEGVVELLDSGVIENTVNDTFGLTAANGRVRAWRQFDGEGEWIELADVKDATYNKGYVGVEGRGFGEHRWDAFYSDELEVEEEVNVEVVVPDAGLATASAPAPDVATGAAPSTTNHNVRGLPLPYPNVLANPARLGPPRFTALERKILGLD